MGNIIPLDQAKKQEIEDLATEFLATFALEYPLAYGVELAKAKLKEMDKEAFAEEEKEKELKYREKGEMKEPRKMGYLIKQGAVVKNWKKRFFVVNPNYTIDYYENEEAHQKGFKAKGSIVPCGYKVESDADSSILEKLKKVAKAMGVDESELPQPDKYPEHTFEVAHDRRRTYYVTAENEEEKKEWIQMFELCCSKAKGFKNPDPVTQRAFVKAHKQARRKSGLWGDPYPRMGGSEEQMLSDSIVELIDWRVMGSVYSNLTGVYIIRKKVREQVVKMLDSMVMAMVIPSYKGLAETTAKMKAPMEEAIDGKKDEVINVQRKITTELADKLDGMIQEHVQDLVEDIEKMEKQLKETTTKALPLLREKTVIRLFDDITNRAKDNDQIEKSLPDYFRTLDKVKLGSWPDQYWPVYNTLKEFHSIIHNANELFKTYHKYGLIYRSIDMLIDVADGAFFTFEELFQELIKGTDALTNGKTAADVMITAKDQVLPKYDHDIKELPSEVSVNGTIDIIVHVISTKIDPLTKDLRRTLSKTIPKPVEQIVSIEDRYELFVQQSVGNFVKKILGIPVPTPSDGEKTSTDL